METLLRGAIRRKTCVTAMYNQGTVLLAPYLLYLRHDQLHVAAMTVKRDGEKPKTEKLATYRVSGLSDIRPTNSLFTPNPGLIAELSHPADEILASVVAR